MTQHFQSTARNTSEGPLPTLPLPASERGLVTTRVVRKGEPLFHAGNECEYIYVVRSGAFKTACVSNQGEEQIIGLHLPGDILGLEALANARYQLEAIALDTSSVFVVPTYVIQRCDDVALHQAVVRRMSEALGRHTETMVVMAQKTASQRVAYFLLRYAQMLSARGLSDTRFVLPMTKGDIASYLNLAPETLSRKLTHLQKTGVVHCDGNAVQVLDMTALHEAAGDHLSVPVVPFGVATVSH